ncbi:valine--tRNA ligase [Lactobacillus sp. DCY120]|uniref:Valine--tRNA ligase n=1 Tax=Bombilactobacillus apium TaxID=2675299 RepID=A0A850RA03_9LACO|nr:valine--tRNA ligase [Bombilactobacillus apium]NVY95658.1 valine--tRNA ligase [Bombilactobacillus apium]
MTTKTEMSAKYNHQEVESGRYEQWVQAGLFKPNGDKKAHPYSIVIPPPNVTGKLHLGHAWDTTIQDILIRQKRMQGFDTLYLPGMDHAGIATQAKVEAKLRTEGKTRYDLGRKEFVAEVWRWKEEYAQIIRQQWAKMGLSVDYSRERFTLDEGLSRAVRKVFVELYNKDLIYRGEYIINWDPELKTALSDIEVEHKDDQGAFYHVKYPLADGSGFVEIATTRPETMPGDVAIAVHPGDSRYQDLIGKEAILPLFGRKLPIIEDQYVDPEFGTGLVKITPAHDPNDFKVGNRHDLERINVMNDDGTMNENAGAYAGLDRFVARKQMVQDLQDQGYMLKVEPIVHSVGHSERSGVQVEPRLSKQWFVKMQPLAEMTLKNQTTAGKVNFVPERFESTFHQWMSEVHDWVISRQLWWGHRIPAWYNRQTEEMYVGEEAPQDSENWEQDPDVLDTWFSSALWPFSTLGWPDTDAADFKRYYPTNALVTGYDIIFFWVARMVFQGLEFTDQRPFKDVILHGLMRDEQGRKMSKSLGNGIDPMEVIDRYGVDALRWFLVTGSAPGQDTRFSYEKVAAGWNFINKIWNASRFVIMNLAETPAPTKVPTGSQLDLADRWILNRLNETVAQVIHLSDKYEFGEVGRALHNFIWNDFCDWYIELSKSTLNASDPQSKASKRTVLAYCLDQILRLLHPIMPFVTEKIWLTMPHEGQSLVVAQYPVVHSELEAAAAAKKMQLLIATIKAIRQIRSQVNAPLSRPIDILIAAQDPEVQAVLMANQAYIQSLAHSKKLTIEPKVMAPKLALTAVIEGAQIYVPLAELVDLQQEIARQEKELTRLEKDVIFLTKKLANPGFVEHAPAEVVAKQRTKLADYQARQAKIKARIQELQNA